MIDAPLNAAHAAQYIVILIVEGVLAAEPAAEVCRWSVKRILRNKIDTHTLSGTVSRGPKLAANIGSEGRDLPNEVVRNIDAAIDCCSGSVTCS